MKTLRRLLVFIVLIVIAGALIGYLYLQRQLRVVQAPPSPNTIIEIPSGLGARGVVHLLRERNIIQDENAALAYLVWTSNRSRLRAGEYLFDKPATIPEIVDKLVSGAIYLHKFTVPEGLTVAETALKWQAQGFGKAEEFLASAKESVSLVHDLDDKADSLEGYLFPETYSFPARSTARQAIEAMVRRMRYVLTQLQKSVPADQWPAGVRETVILASLIEAEAAHDDERPVISAVFWNRLNRQILLQCDPTIVYALKGLNRYRGRLTTADLKLDNPYNTYRYPGLPPSAIMNPGYRSLEAAIKPAASTHIYFVRTEGGRHTFSDTLGAHNKAVAKYRAAQRRTK